MQQIKKLLRKIDKVSNDLLFKYNYPKVESFLNIVPRKNFLKLSDIRNIEKKKVKEIIVIVPENYKRIEKLTYQSIQRKYMDGKWTDPDRQLHFHNYDKSKNGYAETGNNNDPYIVVNDVLQRALEKHLTKLEKQLDKSKAKLKLTKK
jgi:hypothetical protein